MITFLRICMVVEIIAIILLLLSASKIFRWSYRQGDLRRLKLKLIRLRYWRWHTFDVADLGRIMEYAKVVSIPHEHPGDIGTMKAKFKSKQDRILYTLSKP